MKSIIQEEKKCFVSRYFYDQEVIQNLEEHHIFFGSNRSLSEKYGLKVWLTQEWHRGTKGVHGRDGHRLNEYLKQKAQERFMEVYNKTEDEFRALFGKSYI